MAFLIRLFRVLFVLFALRFLSRGIAAWIRGRRPLASGRPGPALLVRDRVCNTFIREDRAYRARIAGRQECFCSAACRDRAIADPSCQLTSESGTFD